MDLEIINPIDYPNWDELQLSSGDNSFFHTSGWARVLAESYGYKPVYFARFEDKRLSFLMPFMEISSPVTGKRGVSLPFTDYCDPFAPEKESLQKSVQAAIIHGSQKKWRYLEWRSSEFLVDGAIPSEVYFTHVLNLQREESEIFSALKENNRRNIRKAQKEGVSIKIEQSFESIRRFYHLNCRTRKHHGLPPQPFVFFHSVFDHIISKNQGIVVTALFSGKVIAAAVYFHFGPHAVFKYGASDAGYLNLRPNNLVMWEAIRWYRDQNFRHLHLGRTEQKNHGLLQFKRSWSVQENSLEYYRYDCKKAAYVQSLSRNVELKAIFTRVPLIILRFIGRLAYRHIG